MHTDSEVQFNTIPLEEEVKLWVDDRRMAPVGWRWARTAAQAQAIIERNNVVSISLDYNLGGNMTGASVAQFMLYKNKHPSTLATHSSNPAGRKEIENVFDKIRARYP